MSRIQKMQVTNRHDDLLARWMGLWMSLGVLPGRVPDLGKLLSIYEAPNRHYHNLSHIRTCLNELDACRLMVKSPALIEVAIWFHDAVYDPSRSDNEERSAELARDMCRKAGLSESQLNEITALVLATRHAEAPASNDGQFIADIDLSIFGQSAEDFDAYERAIETEFQHIAPDVYRNSRAALLQRFLDRPRIYSTPAFQEKHEVLARENLNRSIRRGSAQARERSE